MQPCSRQHRACWLAGMLHAPRQAPWQAVAPSSTVRSVAATAAHLPHAVGGHDEADVLRPQLVKRHCGGEGQGRRETVVRSGARALEACTHHLAQRRGRQTAAAAC